MAGAAMVVCQPHLFLQEIYNTCTQLLTWAEQMEENSSCRPDLIHQESQKLERMVQEFVSRLDHCRETLTVAIDYHNLSEKVRYMFTK